MKYTFICLIFAAAGASAQTLLWSEEFNYASVPDGEVWSYDTGNWGWGNQELQDYTQSTNNVRVDGSNLVITARGSGNYFSSGRIHTQDKLTFQYGTVEARISTPDLAAGLWPAFWTAGNDFPPWPDCGEIDIMEMGNSAGLINGTVNRRVGSAAHWENNGSHALYDGYQLLGSDIDGTFVVYRLEWTPTQIKTYIDGQPIWTFNIAAGAEADLEEFHKPYFFLLNMAVGGTYTGIFDAGGITASFPAEYRVDWIRIYDNGYTQLGGSSVIDPPGPGDNMLENPGFETGSLSPWTGYAPGGANEEGGYVESTNATYYNSAENVLTHSGGYVSKVYGDFTGAENFNGFYQDLDAEPGSVWTASGWALTHPDDLMSGANTAWIEVSFRDASDTILSLYRSSVLNAANVTPGAWMNLQITNQLSTATYEVTGFVDTMEAPEGTATVRYQVVFRQPGYDGGSMYFDDLSLVQPILPFRVHTSVEGNQLQFQFPAQRAVHYQVAYKTNLMDAMWLSLETVIGDGDTQTLSYPVIDRTGFYRISAE